MMPNTGRFDLDLNIKKELKVKKEDAGGSKKPVILLPWPH